MRNLESLDVLWYHGDDINPLILICAGLKELTVRERPKKQTHGTPLSYSFDVALQLWMDKWVKEGFHPQTLNVVSIVHIPVTRLVDRWAHSNPSSPPGQTGYLNVYRSLKVPMDLYPVLPEFQLQFGQSYTLPYVKVSKCGLLGLEQDLLLLTSCTDGNNVIHRARMVMLSNVNRLKSDMTSLTFVTHFDASHCKLLHSSHLEQLAMMCPNLYQLSLKDNRSCLKSLQGLRVIASCGKLQGLNLLGILIKQVKNRLRLWEILVDLRLIYLAIAVCVLLPCGEDDHTKLTVLHTKLTVLLYQKCLNLRGLESYCGDWTCTDCIGFEQSSSSLLSLSSSSSLSTSSSSSSSPPLSSASSSSLSSSSPSPSLLSNFPSLTHCLTTDVPHITLQDVLSSCRNLKCLKNSEIRSLQLSQNCATLEQLCIDSPGIGISDSFMHAISAHGGLVHVVLYVFKVTTEGIATLIANSPKLETCHIYTFFVRSPEGGQLNLRDYTPSLKRKFSNRKLFTCGSCYLTQRQTQGKSSFFHKQDTLDDFLLEHNTDLTSLLP